MSWLNISLGHNYGNSKGLIQPADLAFRSVSLLSASETADVSTRGKKSDVTLDA